MIISEAEARQLAGGNAAFSAQFDRRAAQAAQAAPLLAELDRRRAALDAEFGPRFAQLDQARAALEREYNRRAAELQQTAQTITPGVTGPAGKPSGRPF